MSDRARLWISSEFFQSLNYESVQTFPGHYRVTRIAAVLSGHQVQLQEGSEDPFEPLDNSLGRLTSVDSCSCQSGLYMGLTCRHQFSVANELGYAPQAVANMVLDGMALFPIWTWQAAPAHIHLATDRDERSVHSLLPSVALSGPPMGTPDQSLSTAADKRVPGSRPADNTRTYDSYTMLEMQSHIIAQTRRLVECSDRRTLIGLLQHIEGFSIQQTNGSDPLLTVTNPMLRRTTKSSRTRSIGEACGTATKKG